MKHQVQLSSTVLRLVKVMLLMLKLPVTGME